MINAKVNTRTAVFSFVIVPLLFVLTSCAVSKKISTQANSLLITDSSIRNGFIGISIYEPATNKYWYEYNADKYFIPASNTKLFTLYAGMKYLKDSLVGLRYKLDAYDRTEIYPTGDPTFLHKDFIHQPVLAFLRSQKRIFFQNRNFPEGYGPGWAWDDHEESYMIPRSAFPMYGNLVEAKWVNKDSVLLYPHYFNSKLELRDELENGFQISKPFNRNEYYLYKGKDKTKTIPFETDRITATDLLKDSLHNPNIDWSILSIETLSKDPNIKTIYSQPSDSLFKPMMYNSDNFFAEQTLLMVSNELLGYFSDAEIIDSLLKTDLKDVPQKPRWVDGSGLSRYNLFTPKDLVYILNKLQNEFGLERVENILSPGGKGSLTKYFNFPIPYIYAKTGTIANNCALSGYLITKKHKFLVFSILANHYPGSAVAVRRAFEYFITYIRENY